MRWHVSRLPGPLVDRLLMLLAEVRKITPLSFEILSSSFLPGPQLTRSGNLSEEFNQLVEQRHSALGDRPKQQQNGLYQPFEVGND